MLYRETLKDKKFINIQYKIAKKKLETEFKIIQKCLGINNALAMGNIFVFFIAVFCFYFVIFI